MRDKKTLEVRNGKAKHLSKAGGADGRAVAGGLDDTPLRQLAESIAIDWKNVWFGARPYLDAMLMLDRIDQDFGLGSGREIVIYFLANAQMYKGENGRRVKVELKRR